jgi:hypothetical protein
MNFRLLTPKFGGVGVDDPKAPEAGLLSQPAARCEPGTDQAITPWSGRRMTILHRLRKAAPE